MTDPGPRSIPTAIELIEAERRDLYGQLKALDDALASLRHIEKDVRAVPERIMPRQSSARGRPAYTTEKKQAGADLGRRIGIGAAAKSMGVGWSTIRDWMGRFPETAPAPDEATEAPTLTLIKTLSAGRRRWGCSCGLTFPDEDGWKAHNDKLPQSAYPEHRLTIGTAENE